MRHAKLGFNFTFPKDVDWRDIYSKAAVCRGACGWISPVALLVWRTALFTVWLACSVWEFIDWVEDWDVGSYFIKLSHWSVIVELLYLMLLACTTYMAIQSYGKDGVSTGTPWYVSVTWALGSLLPAVSLLVFILYWVLVYDPDDNPRVVKAVSHGFNWFIVMLDFLTTRQPFLLRHVHLPMMYGAVYSFFTIIFWLADGKNEDGVNTYIYESIDWEDDRGRAIRTVMLSMMIATPLLHFAHWVLRRCCAGYSEEAVERSQKEKANEAVRAAVQAAVIGPANEEDSKAAQPQA